MTSAHLTSKVQVSSQSLLKIMTPWLQLSVVCVQVHRFVQVHLGHEVHCASHEMTVVFRSYCACHRTVTSFENTYRQRATKMIENHNLHIA